MLLAVMLLVMVAVGIASYYANLSNIPYPTIPYLVYRNLFLPYVTLLAAPFPS